MRKANAPEIRTVGIVGLGAFGMLIAQHLSPHFALFGYDIEASAAARASGVSLASLETVGRADLVILATPINALAGALTALRPHLRPGALLMDVASVKMRAAEIMLREAPPDIDLIGAHPLFGPQSAAGGVAGLKIALCPLRGVRTARVAAFLRARLGLKVYFTTPEAHDREAAIVQGITHFVAKVLTRMAPLPERLTTKSYDMLWRGIDMVRDDPPAVFDAIELANPYAPSTRARFLALAAALDGELIARTRPRIAFQGEPGAFGEMAILREWPHAAPAPARTFEDVIELVTSGACALAVLPTWNTTIGPIDRALAAIARGEREVVVEGEIVMPVKHALLALPGATPDGVRWVGSHDAALRQCARYFKERPHLEAVEAFDTAGAARDLGQLGSSASASLQSWFAKLAADKHQLAVLAHASAAAAAGLVVLEDGVQDDPENATRFAVLRRRELDR